MEHQPTAGTVPVHHQIADAIRTQILNGNLSPGDPLPTVAELAAKWRCSPGSARSALAVLREEGRITAGRGKPATVRTPPARKSLALSPEWTQIQKDLVLQPEGERAKKGAIELTAGVPIDDTVSTHRYERILADRELAEEFGLPVGTELMQRSYEMTDKESGHRLSHSVSYIPLRLIESNPALLDESNEPWPGGHQHQLFTVGIEIDHFLRKVTAIQPSTGDRQKWGMDSGVSLLWVRSKSVDIDDRVVELSDATYPADRTEIALKEELRRWTDAEVEEARKHQ